MLAKESPDAPTTTKATDSTLPRPAGATTEVEVVSGCGSGWAAMMVSYPGMSELGLLFLSRLFLSRSSRSPPLTRRP